MNPTPTIFCSRCRAFRWVEDWSEGRDERLSIVLGPCGHVVDRAARLEWSVPTQRARVRQHLVSVTAAREPFATS